MQRARLLSAAVSAVEDLGYARTTVAHITDRARVSRRTFYDLFGNREDCLLAVLHGAVEQIQAELAATDLAGLAWRERIRTGLWRILCLLDRDPALARMCIVQSARGSQRVLEYREETLARLAVAIDEGRHESARAAECPGLAAEGVVGAALSILYTRLLKGQRTPLKDLLGELMGLIVLPYLGMAAARRERLRAAPPVVVHQLRPQTLELSLAAEHSHTLPMRLTYRTARVLEEVAQHPGVSNRTVAERVGIVDQGQISKLLARLERLGLLLNTGEGHTKGEPNAWRLTASGEQLIERIQFNPRHSRQAAR
jgi:AcrR family transcriptional regulator